MVDGILKSLQHDDHYNKASESSNNDTDASKWYSCLSERERRLLERLALFEGRVEALQSMKEELYTNLVGPESSSSLKE